MEHILYIFTTLFVAIIGGTFFDWSNAINPALARLSEREYVKVVQLTNRVIETPLFLLSFMGPVILLPILILFYSSVGSTEFWLLCASAVTYIFGTFGPTMAKNVPLNRRIDKVDLDDNRAVVEAKKWFQAPWNRFHTIRTFMCIISLVFLLTLVTTQL